jgi:hypothetical protein
MIPGLAVLILTPYAKEGKVSASRIETISVSKNETGSLRIWDCF